MSERHPDVKQLNRTFIGSVLFIDIVGYSTRSVQEQLEMKEAFNAFIADAVRNVATSERIMVDSGDGAAIAFLGDPEDALFAALSLRDAIDAAKLAPGEPDFVRMGVNLGPLKIVRDINGHTNMIGDGVNDAQRVMSFAEPGQVMVSHSYYDIISRFSRDYAQLFVYEGMRHDKHVREHELYRFGPSADMPDLAEKLRGRTLARSAGGGTGDASTMHVDWARDKVREVSAPLQRVVHSRTGLVAAGVGALTIVGAVWSWTSTPQRPVIVATAPPAPASSAPVQVVAAPQVAPAASVEQSAPPPKPGTVRLAIQPWGEIYVDDRRRGLSPPMKSLKLPPGEHQVEVRNGNFAPYKQTVVVKSNAETTVRHVF
jgi:class 3 adenylate cyclase